jgi:UDP-N-acetylmuramoyl-L-alanyl-D-glutamate--2,6-diaminopimelate ligase
VDYAHTPDALAAALKSIRPSLKGRLIVLFGCGGDRDKEKRPQMGKIAADLADISIITDDNPRFETPETIRKEILESCPNGIEIGDREKAISTALLDLKDNDVLLIAGKGHEEGQSIEGKIIPFNDEQMVHHVLAKNSQALRGSEK